MNQMFIERNQVESNCAFEFIQILNLNRNHAWRAYFPNQIQIIYGEEKSPTPIRGNVHHHFLMIQTLMQRNQFHCIFSLSQQYLQ